MTSLATVWRDAALRQALLTDPRPGLRALGIAIPDDVAVKTLGSKGTPADRGATLLQFVLERGPLFSFFFMPSPLHSSAQQAAYGEIIGSSVDDPAFEHRLRVDAAAALQAVGAVSADAAN
ncbi:MAG: hypothetical protein P4L71_00040 [Acetobacteraceae bacterium]|nr:hypothetical protein [Acetobacteraceae bacterium]